MADTNGTGDMVVFHIAPADRGAHKRGPLGAWIKSMMGRLSVIVVCGTDRTVYSADPAVLDAVREMGVVEIFSD